MAICVCIYTCISGVVYDAVSIDVTSSGIRSVHDQNFDLQYLPGFGCYVQRSSPFLRMQVIGISAEG